MKKLQYVQPQQVVVAIPAATPLMAGSITIDAGDTDIIDGGGGGGEPALAPPTVEDPVHMLLGI